MKLILSFLFVFFIFSSHSKAGIYIEPYIATNLASSYDLDKIPTGFTDHEGDVSGSLYGAKIGWLHKNKVFGGIEYSKSEIDLTITGSDTRVNSLNAAGTSLIDKLTGTHWGLFGGTKEGDGYGWVKVGATAYKDKNNNSTLGIGDELSGTYYAVGAGYDIGIMFFVEYRRHTLKTLEDVSVDVEINLPDESSGRGFYDIKEVLVGISIPLKF